MSWAKRDRIGQADQLIDTTVGNIGPEAGATVTLQVYSGTTLKRTYAGLTSSSWSCPLAEDMADGPPRTCALSCAVSATASTLAAARHHD
ncbi:hypothetical protein P4237_12185 [Pseudomonas aeruginosa]|nr:hypothetical protein [Pseudomonas aeruginosa]